jgi:hypothetical protein
VVGILAEDTAGRGVRAARAAVTVDRVAMAVRVARAAALVDHAAASGNISGRRKFASSASRRWT